MWPSAVRGIMFARKRNRKAVTTQGKQKNFLEEEKITSQVREMLSEFAHVGF